MAGDLDRIRRCYGINSKDVDLPTASNILVLARATTRIIVLLGATFAPSVYVAGTIQLVDSLTNKVVGVLTIPPTTGMGVDQVRLTYDTVGTALSTGANLVLGTLPAGATGRLHIETYQKGRG